MDKAERIKDLIKTLNEASISYYKYDNPTMTDKQYDDLYDELLDLEKETGIVMVNSPTQKVQGETIEYLEKVQHKKPMLSANKTKNISEIKSREHFSFACFCFYKQLDAILDPQEVFSKRISATSRIPKARKYASSLGIHFSKNSRARSPSRARIRRRCSSGGISRNTERS